MSVKGMFSLEVCLTPALFKKRQVGNNLVIVVIDVLRATTAMCMALYNGAVALIPVSSLAEARRKKQEGFLVAAERDGLKPSFADFGNSPSEFTARKIKGKRLIYTTTNGTRAIKKAEGSGDIVLGSFLNLDTLTEWLTGQKRNILVLCAGWKEHVSLEDTLLAGALTERLMAQRPYELKGDEVGMSLELWQAAKKDLHAFAAKGEHFQRLLQEGIEKRPETFLNPGNLPVIPVFENGMIINALEE